jgi:hypothetical protein
MFRTVTTRHATERDNASQAAVRRGFDEKSGERRGDQLTNTTPLIACFRNIFAAKLPELMPANQLRMASSLMCRLDKRADYVQLLGHIQRRRMTAAFYLYDLQKP